MSAIRSESFELHRELTTQDEIRLLILSPGRGSGSVCCRLTHVSLASKPKYEALSYAWGDASETSDIECGGQPIRVTRSLESALRNLRDPTRDRILWADALCIDQANSSEKSHQVQLMAKIYSYSERALIWLGEETEELTASFRALNFLHEMFLEHEEDYPHGAERYYHYPDGPYPNFERLKTTADEWAEPVVHLIGQPWFLRRWVIQEVARAPHATVVCGHRLLSWSNLAAVFWSLAANCAFQLLQPSQTLQSSQVTAAMTSVIIMELIRRDVIEKGGSALLGLLISVRCYQSGDPRDIIFSLLGIASELSCYGDDVTPDYNAPVEEVYRRFVVAHITRRNSLLTLSTPYDYSKSTSLNLPSWVPDFAQLDMTNPLMHLRNDPGLPFHASGDTEQRVRLSKDNTILHVLGRIIDTIKDIGPAFEEVTASSAHFSEKSRQERTQLFAQNIKSWLHQSLDLAFSAPSGSEASSSRFEDFWRTMMCNITAGGERPDPGLSIASANLLKILDIPSPVAVDLPQPVLEQILIVETALGRWAYGWRLCTTDNGRLGRVLSSVQTGDVVCVLYGGEVPYVIRPCGDGQFKFVGSCYIHGLMDGEALQIEGLEDEEFAFC